MAETKPTRSLKVRPTETFRDRATKAQQAPIKTKRTAKFLKLLLWPFRKIGRGLVIIFRPLRFLLKPFKSRPARFIGRILAAILLLKYFRNSWRELRDVTWPSRKETRQLSLAVFAFAIIFGLLITVTDYGLDKLFKKLLLKQ